MEQKVEELGKGVAPLSVMSSAIRNALSNHELVMRGKVPWFETTFLALLMLYAQR